MNPNKKQQQNNIKGIIFDLDGTLLNTIPDIAFSANYALEKFGYPTHNQDTIKHFLGNGSRVLITKAMPEDKRDEHHIEPVLNFYLEIYKNLKQERTKPYDGIEELLTILHSKNIKTAVVTNKNDFLAEKCIKKFLPGHSFEAVIGQNDSYPPKPHRHMADKAVESMKQANQNCLFLGDTHVDIKTGANAEIKTIGVTWGFRPKQELIEAGAWNIINKPLELLDLI